MEATANATSPWGPVQSVHSHKQNKPNHSHKDSINRAKAAEERARAAEVALEACKRENEKSQWTILRLKKSQAASEKLAERFRKQNASVLGGNWLILEGQK